MLIFLVARLGRGGGYLDLCDGKYIMSMHWILNVKSIFEGYEDTPNLERLA